MLNHKQCDAFLAVAETGSFDLAAEQLCITASAVTLRVQSLRKKFGAFTDCAGKTLPPRHKQVNRCYIICNIADC